MPPCSCDKGEGSKGQKQGKDFEEKSKEIRGNRGE